MSVSITQKFAIGALVGVTAVSVATAEPLSPLRHNPFQRPAILDVPPKPQAVSPGVSEEPPMLNGTLVSAGTPMAIVGGELLKVGEEHAGYRLVAVAEGAATLEKQGKEIQVLIMNPVSNTGVRSSMR